MTTVDFRKMVATEGVENILIMFAMQPLHQLLFMKYTSSNDPYYIVPCYIDEHTYNVQDGYKITLESMLPGFGHRHMYLNDFIQVINSGQATIYSKTTDESVQTHDDANKLFNEVVTAAKQWGSSTNDYEADGGKALMSHLRSRFIAAIFNNRRNV